MGSLGSLGVASGHLGDARADTTRDAATGRGNEGETARRGTVGWDSQNGEVVEVAWEKWDPFGVHRVS